MQQCQSINSIIEKVLDTKAFSLLSVCTRCRGRRVQTYIQQTAKQQRFTSNYNKLKLKNTMKNKLELWKGVMKIWLIQLFKHGHNSTQPLTISTTVFLQFSFDFRRVWHFNRAKKVFFFCMETSLRGRTTFKPHPRRRFFYFFFFLFQISSKMSASIHSGSLLLISTPVKVVAAAANTEKDTMSWHSGQRKDFEIGPGFQKPS